MIRMLPPPVIDPSTWMINICFSVVSLLVVWLLPHEIVGEVPIPVLFRQHMLAYDCCFFSILFTFMGSWMGINDRKGNAVEPFDPGCYSDSESSSFKQKAVEVDRSNEASELEVIKAMCGEKDFFKGSSRELSPPGPKIYEENLVGESSKLENVSVPQALNVGGLSYKDALILASDIDVVGKVNEKNLGGPGDSSKKKVGLEKVALEKVRCESGSGNKLCAWADKIDHVINEGLICSDKKINELGVLGENEFDFYTEIEGRKKGKRGKKARKFGSLVDLQNQVLSGTERLNRDEALRKAGVSREQLQCSELSGKSLSDSDIKAKVSSLFSEARKIGKKIGIQIVGEEKEAIQELVQIQRRKSC
ncbi:hypothetical protein V6N13_013426 [Hibiscus sabdariffa]